MSAVRKLQAEPELPEPRAALAAAIERVKESEEAIRACRREQEDAQAKIRTLRSEIERDEAELEATSALERKPKRAALAVKREDLEDLQQHLVELQKKEGEGSMPLAGSLSPSCGAARNEKPGQRAGLDFLSLASNRLALSRGPPFRIAGSLRNEFSRARFFQRVAALADCRCRSLTGIGV